MTNVEKKIVSQSALQQICNELHSQQKRIVTTNGSFDIIHAGHVRGLAMARSKGDVLIVGLNSDESVRSYKGPNRPINPQEDRAYLLAALECVDYVCIFDGVEIGAPLIGITHPQTHATGAQYGTECPEAPAVKAAGAELFLIPMLSGRSTSAIIEKIITLYTAEKH